ncbi:hypothetical protein ACFWQC_27305 [Nocardioides sp. NPDC058538]|uniref:hypothetical protein n=1 Tax=Nocardioides sp. NPDC058538 TaxID=3346542 RepID=UPI00364D1380
MNCLTRPFARLAASIATALGILLVVAGQAAAKYPDPQTGGAGDVPPTPGTAPAQPVTDTAVSALQWSLLALAVLAALVIGAAIATAVQRHRTARPVL